MRITIEKILIRGKSYGNPYFKIIIVQIIKTVVVTANTFKLGPIAKIGSPFIK